MHNEIETTTMTTEPVFTHSDYQSKDLTENKKGSGFTTGLVLGGLAGAAAALLMAPKKGGELREDIKNTSVKLKDRTMQMKDEARLKAKLGKMDAMDTVDSVKEKSSQMSFSARQKLQEAKNAVDEAKKEAEEMQTTTSSTPTTSTSTSISGMGTKPVSSVSTQQKTGTDNGYEKKQSDLNTK